MFTILINIIKIAFLLGFLILIHESGHFFAAKLCKVKVLEFAIGFGPTIWRKQGKETKYALRLIPLGGFVNMLGEEVQSEETGAFNKASIWKRILIVIAGGFINIIFGIIVYFILVWVLVNLRSAFLSTGYFCTTMLTTLKELFTGAINTEQLMGPVGISEIVVQTKEFMDFVYLLAVVSLSLGVTNLLPFPPLDGGKVLLILIEGIRKKPMKQNVEAAIQMTGFFLLIGLSIYVTYNDILKIAS